MPKTEQHDPVTQYALDVVSGVKPMGRYVTQACQRHLDDLETAEKRGLHFNPQQAAFAIQFFRFLRHSKGEFRGQPFILQDWQQFIIGSLFGWKRKNGYRRFKKAYTEIAKKNGKSTLCSGVSLLMLMADGEGGAEVYSAAASKKQASIVFNECQRMVKNSPVLKSRVESQKTGLYFHAMDSSMMPCSSEADNLDGINPHCGIIDELHRHKNGEVLDVIENSMIARTQPLTFIITTAGSDTSGICYQEREYGIKVLDHIIEDDEYFAYIACIDQEDDWTDPECWHKANPSLGQSLPLEALLSKSNAAQASSAKKGAFLRYHMNRWTEGAETWLNIDKWRECGTDYTFEDLKGRDAYLGLDLSARLDLTVAIWVCPPTADDPQYRIWPMFFLPEENLAEKAKKDRVPYKQWVEDGYLTETMGDVVDYEVVREWIHKTAPNFNVKEVAMDEWGGTQFSTQLQEDGFDVVGVRQGIKTLSPPSKELEVIVTNKTFNHGNNPIMTWMASNTVVRKDNNENYMPDKKGSRFRIDGIVATIIALARIMADDKETSVYETRGLRTL